MIEVRVALPISETDFTRELHSILERVRQGSEVVVERDNRAIAVLKPAESPRRRISECIAMLPGDSTATIDPLFAADVEAAVAAHREPLEPPAWD